MHELRTEPRQRRSQQSIDAILDAAERLIHERGQVSFTANELAMAADMSIGRVYYWFPDIPAVVSALAERASSRMVATFAELLDQQRTVTTPVLIQRCVRGLCEFIDHNPATTALCLTGGEEGYGRQLYEQLVTYVRPLVSDRVEEPTEQEIELVARTGVNILLGVLHRYTWAGEQRDHIEQELVYLLTAWLYCRYPSPDDPIWNRPAGTVQPARRPRQDLVYTAKGSVWPALAPNQPTA